jgi:acyl-CoA synthetase (AMP-forming)/AMP-acid ligase II
MMLDRLEHRIRHAPHRAALLASGRRGELRVAATYGELGSLADEFTAGLITRGLTTADTVGVAVRPGPRALALLLALRRRRLRAAVLDPTAGEEVLRARLALARPAIVVADATAQAAAGWARPLARRAGLALPRLAELGPVATVGRWLPGCAPPLAAGGPVPEPAAGAPGDGASEDGDGDAVIVFTSGTTARPRAIVHSWESLDAGMTAVAGLVAPRPGEPVLGGTFFVLLPALALGAPVALPARGPRALARQLHPLARSARFTGRVWSGSAPVSAELLTRVRAAGADEAWGVYALTELFPAAAVEQREKAAFDGPGDLAGTPLPGVRVRVENGELLLAGPAARPYCLGEPPEPWVRTGDRGLLDRGRIVLAGRSKDMVVRRAENIYPGLHEPALQVPGVELALLVGVPAGDGDERLVALVQPCPGAEPRRIRAALTGPLARMGGARPDAVVFGTVPLSGRSRKPDRAAAALRAAALLGTGRAGGAR